MQKITAAPLKKCIYCGGKTERLISAGTGFIFKGTGFYTTDYKKKLPPEKPSSDTGVKKAEPKKEKSLEK